jgi:SAM-dependent methyltransferase
MTAPLRPSSDPVPEVLEWEAAYQRFETPEEESTKFEKRLRRLGALEMDREHRVLEMMCGRGNGIRAWQRLGFANVTGLDLSPELTATYTGEARCLVGDVRKMPLDDASMDVACVQGGLHHLESIEDLRLALAEVRRVLVPGGRVLLVEPWDTPFLRFVHAMCRIRPVCAAWPKLDALATMIRLEGDTYRRWLGQPDAILAEIGKALDVRHTKVSWGKLELIAFRR